MTKKFKRLRDYDVLLQIKNDDFINPPLVSQRNWILNKAMNEFVDDLEHLDKVAKKFVPGAQAVALHDRSQQELKDEEIMEDWQNPLMKEMAAVVSATHGNVLEIGFGLGVSAGFIQECKVKSHTIIECNDSVIKRFNKWEKCYPKSHIQIVPGKWQDVIDSLGKYDGIFFHTYPLNETEYLDQIVQSTTFAEHFFATASDHLEDGGIFTYLTNEIDSLSRSHQRLIFKYFHSMEIKIIEPLNMPHDTKDAWWADSMVVIKAVK